MTMMDLRNRLSHTFLTSFVHGRFVAEQGNRYLPTACTLRRSLQLMCPHHLRGVKFPITVTPHTLEFVMSFSFFAKYGRMPSERSDLFVQK
ncbi:hypothetical protein KIN20_002332 [Parelaphostrongylus tenuis]|uniref:Uncharacterized protein n=1 Tax=Parelaphostrongylus tenuis TaxID=148309 RepID=A0AAD5QF81_PARTN|nr:hypothetical protein KIN20_002332 [Parelaphostrongylus tenuis]